MRTFVRSRGGRSYYSHMHYNTCNTTLPYMQLGCADHHAKHLIIALCSCYFPLFLLLNVNVYYYILITILLNKYKS